MENIFKKSFSGMEAELSSEKREMLEQLKKAASGILKSFRQNPANKPAEGGKIKENLVIVAEETVDELVRRAFYESGRADFEQECRMVVISELGSSGADLPEAVGRKMLSATNILLLGIHSMSHSSSTKEAWRPKKSLEKGVPGKEKDIEEWLAKKQAEGKMLQNEDGSPKKFPNLSDEQLDKWYEMFRGASVISIPDAYPESFMHECFLVDKEEIARKVHKVKELFEESVSAKVTSPSGTDILVEFDHNKYPVLAEEAQIGRDNKGENFMNAPSGETAVRPSNINGKFVIDGFCADNPLETDSEGKVIYPIEINFKDGIAEIENNNPAAARLVEMCENAQKNSRYRGEDGNPYQAAEFAVGVLGKPDKKGRIDFTLNNATIDEKLTLHVAIGKDDMIGGINKIELHIDFGCQGASVFLFDNGEGKEDESIICLMENGRLLIDERGELIKS